MQQSCEGSKKDNYTYCLYTLLCPTIVESRVIVKIMSMVNGFAYLVVFESRKTGADDSTEVDRTFLFAQAQAEKESKGHSG